MIIMYSKRRNNGFDLARTSVLAGISVLAPDSPTLYVRLGIQRTIFFLGLALGGSAQGPHGPTQVPHLLTVAFPSAFVRHRRPSPLGSGSISRQDLPPEI